MCLDDVDFDDAVLDFLLRQGGDGEQVACGFILLGDAGGDAVDIGQRYLFADEGRVEFGEFISGEDGVAGEFYAPKNKRKLFCAGWCRDGLGERQVDLGLGGQALLAVKIVTLESAGFGAGGQGRLGESMAAAEQGEQAKKLMVQAAANGLFFWLFHPIALA